MIGTNIRGIRHLWKISNSSLTFILSKDRDCNYDICTAVKTTSDSCIGECLLIFNHRYNQNLFGFNEVVKGMDEKDKNYILHTYGRVFVLPQTTREVTDKNAERYFTEMTLLPLTFNDDYQAFLKENANLINNLSSKYDFSTNEARIKSLYIYTDGSKNFFQWAVNLYYKGCCSMAAIKNIMMWNTCYNQLTKKLSHGSITAYNSTKAIGELMIELSTLRLEKRVNDTINSFNTQQKKLFHSHELTDIDKKTLARFARLSDTKKLNFIRKASTIEDYQELMRQMRHICSIHFSWSKESLMDYIENVEDVKYDLVYETDTIVLVKVKDYETVKQLAKTTNWCISKNKYYWNNYITSTNGMATQYMLFDFSKLEDDNLSIIGFTSAYNKGITAAHNFVNESLMEKRNSLPPSLKSYLLRFNDSQNIYSILNKCGVDINLIIHYDKPQYEWNYEGFMKYLYECVDKDNVTILSHNGSKLAISVHDEGIKYFFGDVYMDNLPSCSAKCQHIIFADFSLSQFDPNHIVFGVIQSDYTNEDYCNAVYDENISELGSSTFNDKLNEYGLPYNTIRRTINHERELVNAFSSYSMPILQHQAEQDYKLFFNIITSKFDKDSLFSILYQTTIEFLSFDYLNLIYNHGAKIVHFLGPSYTSDLVREIYLHLSIVGNRLYNGKNYPLPTKEQIDNFYDNKLQTHDETIYVGLYIMLKRIIINETIKDVNYNKMYTRLLRELITSEAHGTMIDDLAKALIPRLNFSSATTITMGFVKHCLKYGSNDVKKNIAEIASQYSWIGETCQVEA